MRTRCGSLRTASRAGLPQQWQAPRAPRLFQWASQVGGRICLGAARLIPETPAPHRAAAPPFPCGRQRRRAMSSSNNDGEWIAKPGLVIRFNTLEAGLRQALVKFKAATTPSERRDATRRSLSDVIDFIRSFHPSHNPILAAPLVELFAALADLDRGVQQGILTPAPVAHRPPEELPREHIKAYAAA